MAGVGTDQYLPDNMEDNSMGFNHQSPGGDIEMGNGHGGQGYQGQQKQTAGGGNGIVMQDSNELNETQKLQLAERANEIYRQQLKYMQDHLASLRSLIQDKENIIENLMLRYDLGIITQDQNRTGGNLSPDEIEMEELRRKAEALAQRTILENFELREMVNELRDENFHLRNEIYELQDKINRQVLQINKLEKQQQNASQQQQQQSIGTTMDDPYEEEHQEEDIYGDVEEDDPYAAGGDDDEMGSHNRGQSITGNDWLNNETTDRLTGRRGSQQMDHPKYSEEAVKKREERAAKHVRKESVKPPNLFNDGSDEDDYMDDAARAKRTERQNKTRKESIATPDIYGDQQGDSEEDEDEQPQGSRRRGSQVYMDAEAQRKREERAAKHRRGSSVATPNIFHDNYDPEKVAKAKAQKDSPEAVKKRLTRKAKRVGAAAVKYVKSHRRKESLAEKLLLGPIGDDEFKIDDPEERKELQKKARQEQRRKSRQLIKSQVGAKEHFSDDDVELQEDKPQRSQLKSRKKSSQRGNKQEDDFDVKAMQSQKNNKKRPSITADAAKPLTAEQNRGKHRRDSSTPIVNLGFEDPDVLLHYEKLKVQDLEKELEGKLNELDKVKQERDQIKGQFELKDKTANKAVQEKVVFERELDEAIQSKADLAQKCAMEIMRLTMILNTLQQMPKFKEVVQILMDESVKEQNKNGSLLG